MVRLLLDSLADPGARAAQDNSYLSNFLVSLLFVSPVDDICDIQYLQRKSDACLDDKVIAKNKVVQFFAAQCII